MLCLFFFSLSLQCDGAVEGLVEMGLQKSDKHFLDTEGACGIPVKTQLKRRDVALGVNFDFL